MQMEVSMRTHSEDLERIHLLPLEERQMLLQGSPRLDGLGVRTELATHVHALDSSEKQCSVAKPLVPNLLLKFPLSKRGTLSGTICQ